MPSSHTYSDGSAGFFLYRVSDGTHSHLHRVHVRTATIDNVTDPGSPANINGLIATEGDVNATARNFLTFIKALTSTGFTIDLQDFQPVVGGVPSGPRQNLQPYSLTANGGTSTFPEAETDYTFRDGEGAPCRFVVFGGPATRWNPGVKAALVPDWGGVDINSAFAAYLLGIAFVTDSYPANMTNVVSHHGSRLGTALAVVSTLNNRLRRAYRVK